MSDVRDDVAGTLRFMQYHEVRTVSGGEWEPLEAVDGRFGTTSETEVHVSKGRPTARLVDGDTGETVGTARLSCPME